MRVVQAGAMEVTLANDHQPIPIHLKLVLRPQAKTATLSTRFRFATINVKQFCELLRFKTCMSKPGVLRLIHLDTGLQMLELQTTGAGDAPAKQFTEAMAALADMQAKLKRPIDIPARDFSEDEWETIVRLSLIVRTGKLIGEWTSISFSLPPEGATNLLAAFGGGQVNVAFVDVETTEELFGVELPLGIERQMYQQARLANEDDVRRALQAAESDGTQVETRLVPGDDHTVIMEYLDWLNRPSS